MENDVFHMHMEPLGVLNNNILVALEICTYFYKKKFKNLKISSYLDLKIFLMIIYQDSKNCTCFKCWILNGMRSWFTRPSKEAGISSSIEGYTFLSPYQND
jgi:hypothetical protein